MKYFRLVLIFLIVFCYVSTITAELRFVILGDFGGTSTRPYSLRSQRRVSMEISKIPDVDFFVVTGDNFYFNGVKNVEDFRFQETFEKVYSYPTLQKNWYITPGNHDYHGNVSAQILYSRRSPRWIFPYYYHTKVFTIPQTNKTLQLVMIDTNILCYPKLVKKHKTPDSEAQMQWINEILNKSNANYLIFIGHHPLYSAGQHGNTECLHNKLLHLLKQYKVDAYISGHDHNLQHITLENSTLESFVCGSSNFFSNWQPNFLKLKPNRLRAFFGKQPGFIIAHAGEEYLNIELRTIDERQKYETKLLMRRKLLEHYDDKRPREILKQISHTRKIEDFLFYYIVLYLFILLCIVYHRKRFTSF
ncbi:tartrate-resistant acid phosphatase type 5-like [Xenia sp. Carnegie-2017]|uniref:tartrate-resistant acid phosphatase type 5-like n=1 Tax=Xenia sp. Carnegie-2017 TaxID=2897299 RepID=UPI001F04CDC3|nr:tartrate-resistant acid phosphatase type 5-like [Xenia sp. Carnegie-2017]